MSPRKRTGSAASKSAKEEKSSGAKDEKAPGFSAEERAAMKERVREMKAEARGGSRAEKRASGEADVLEKIGEMAGADRALAERLHALIMAAAPDLAPKTWYGMPAYARDGNVVCFFQSAGKFKARYATLGFSDKAHLDEGAMWPTGFALRELTPDVEKRIVGLVRKALDRGSQGS